MVAACGNPLSEARVEPEPRQSPAVEPWTLRDATLYLPVPLIEARDRQAQLGPYMGRLQDEARAVFATVPVGDGVSGSVVFIVQPGQKSLFRVVAGEPDLAQDIQALLIDRLGKVAPPDVEGGPVMASLNFDAWGGGTRPPNEPTPLPAAWASLMPPGGGRIDDTFIEAVWQKEN